MIELLKRAIEYQLRKNAMKATEDYNANAKANAAETAEEFIDQICEQLADKGEASDDLRNDYAGGDSWHHESHVDKDYRFREACEILMQLDDHEETDSGLWQGKDMKEAVSTCAAFTYGNAVYHHWRQLIEKINEDFDADAIDEGMDDAAANYDRVRGERIRAFVEQTIEEFKS